MESFTVVTSADRAKSCGQWVVATDDSVGQVSYQVGACLALVTLARFHIAALADRSVRQLQRAGVVAAGVTKVAHSCEDVAGMLGALGRRLQAAKFAGVGVVLTSANKQLRVWVAGAGRPARLSRCERRAEHLLGELEAVRARALSEVSVDKATR
ncbi:hypothetical protein [Pseudactinotalea sp.]|uniref:hypothetical protein n=1 Tax=Pseudactinotalea sp. TaxID=1926260 RepID=UPI003B3A1612